MEFLSEEQVRFYQTNGYLILPNHLQSSIIDDARAEITQLSQHATKIDQSDDLIDVENSHSRTQPRIRRIKRPDLQSEFFNNLMRSDHILGPARDLLGPNIRMHTTKLNMKKAQYGAPVQWHQDVAFYPHTNDDVLAIGVVFDDVEFENGPLQVFPGSHKGPVLDHHHDGVFSGSVDLEEAGLDMADAVSLIGPAGTISIHHGRMLHGSALNTSPRDRQILFYEMMAADAFPVTGAMTPFTTMEDYDSRMLCGETTKQPRLENIPIRIPQPQPAKAGSIYEIQSQGKGGYETFEQKRNTT